ncbi:MAG: hypothetical protein DRG78_01755 [Epsilonproteobacteria bacterium]|nr:MAG: hypothetical protein DRG78_01755 [Campylobacterota bacterium]
MGKNKKSKKQNKILKISRFETIISDIYNDLLKIVPKHIRENITPTNMIYRIISILIFGFIMSLYLYLPFIVYMGHYHIFPYDFFGEQGVLAINIFSFFIILFILTMSILFTGGISNIIVSRYYKIKSFSNDTIMLIMNICFIVFLGISILTLSIPAEFMKNISWFIFAFILSLLITLHMGMLYYANVKTQIFSVISIFGFAIPLLVFILFNSSAASLVSITLKKFGVGGEIEATVTRISDSDCTEGYLIFLSPNSIYLKSKQNNIIMNVNKKDYNFAFSSICKRDNQDSDNNTTK